MIGHLLLEQRPVFHIFHRLSLILAKSGVQVVFTAIFRTTSPCLEPTMSTLVGGERRARIAVEGCVSVFV